MASSTSTSSSNQTLNNSASNISLLQVVQHGAINTSFNPPSLSVKLDGDNYHIWAPTVMSAFEAFELAPLVTRDNTEPLMFLHAKENGTINLNLDDATWSRKDKLTLLWLQSTISKRILVHITRMSTARQAWVMLERIFKSQSKAKTMHLWL